MKKIFVLAVISMSILILGCGADKMADNRSDDTLGITTKEFQDRYNANLAYLKGLDYNKLKIDGFGFKNSDHFYNDSNPDDFIDHDWMITAKTDSNKIKELNITTEIKVRVVFDLVMSAIFHSVESESAFSDEKQVTELMDMLDQMMRELKPFNGNENDKRSVIIRSGYKYEFSAWRFPGESRQTATITITRAKNDSPQ